MGGVGSRGGHRWLDNRYLSNLTIQTLRPPHRVGIVDVTWTQPDGSPSPTLAELVNQYRVKVTATAVEMIRNAAASEQEITEAVQSELPDGTALTRLEYRVKSPASLCRKIQATAWRLADPDPWHIQHKITDVLRYTITSSEPLAAKFMIENLRRNGWDVPDTNIETVNSDTVNGDRPPLPDRPRRQIVRYGGLAVELQFRAQDTGVNDGLLLGL